MSTPPYVVLDKKVGETPLSCVEAWRSTRSEYESISLSYAGRLDPMASGKLLILIGEECKKQAAYHGLDKQYDIEVLFGVGSDSGDVLGIVAEDARISITKEILENICGDFIGEIELPYPAYSAKTVSGIPLHTWAVTGTIDQITIPKKHSTIYSITVNSITTITRPELVATATAKINSLPTVTDPKKSLGNDFRRPDVHKSWDTIAKNGTNTDQFHIAALTIQASSGTYMRTISEVLAGKFGTRGLALSIHRTHIGKYDKATAEWSILFT